MDGPSMRLEPMTYLWPIVFLKTRQNKIDFLLNKTFLCACVCVRACVCLGLVLLLVRWVSVKRITTVSLLYPHTVSKTYIHKTHFPRHPTPTLHSVWRRFEKPWILFRIGETKQHIWQCSNGGGRTEIEHVCVPLIIFYRRADWTKPLNKSQSTILISNRQIMTGKMQCVTLKYLCSISWHIRLRIKNINPHW